MNNCCFPGLILVFLASLISLNASGSSTITFNTSQPNLKIAMMSGNMMGRGMMDGNTMGPGMPGSSSNSRNAPESTVSPLEAYIGNQHLSCFSCHAISRNRIGPSFDDIAQRYAGDPDAERMLSGAILQGVVGKWQGYGGMPGKLASPEQAGELAHLIMDLTKAK